MAQLCRRPSTAAGWARAARRRGISWDAHAARGGGLLVADSSCYLLVLYYVWSNVRRRLTRRQRGRLWQPRLLAPSVGAAAERVDCP